MTFQICLKYPHGKQHLNQRNVLTFSKIEEVKIGLNPGFKKMNNDGI